MFTWQRYWLKKQQKHQKKQTSLCSHNQVPIFIHVLELFFSTEAFSPIVLRCKWFDSSQLSKNEKGHTQRKRWNPFLKTTPLYNHWHITIPFYYLTFCSRDLCKSWPRCPCSPPFRSVVNVSNEGGPRVGHFPPWGPEVLGAPTERSSTLQSLWLNQLFLSFILFFFFFYCGRLPGRCGECGTRVSRSAPANCARLHVDLLLNIYVITTGWGLQERGVDVMAWLTTGMF